MTSTQHIKTRRRLAMVCSVPLAISLLLFSITIITEDIHRWIIAVFVVGTAVMIGALVWLYFEVLSYHEARERAQAELREANAQLEARVADRTRDLTSANE